MLILTIINTVFVIIGVLLGVPQVIRWIDKDQNKKVLYRSSITYSNHDILFTIKEQQTIIEAGVVIACIKTEWESAYGFLDGDIPKHAVLRIKLPESDKTDNYSMKIGENLTFTNDGEKYLLIVMRIYNHFFLGTRVSLLLKKQ